MNINELVNEAVNTSYYNPSASDRALPPSNRPKLLTGGPKGSGTNPTSGNDRLTMGDKSVLVGGAALGLAGVNHAVNRATSTLGRLKQHVNGEFPNSDLRRKIASTWVKAQAAKQHMGY